MAKITIITDGNKMEVESELTSTCIEKKMSGEKRYAFRFSNGEIDVDECEMNDLIARYKQLKIEQNGFDDDDDY